jgi:hypothetical protein
MQEIKAILSALQVQAGLHGQDLVTIQKSLQKVAQFIEQHDGRLKALEAVRQQVPAEKVRYVPDYDVEPDPQP